MNKLAEIIKSRKDPAGYLEERLRTLLAELEDIKRQAKKDIVEAVREARTDAVFGDLDPAKELAAKTARAEIASFKTDVNDKVAGVLERMETARVAILERVDTRIATAVADFEKEKDQLLAGAGEALGTLETATRTRLDKITAAVDAKRGPQGEPGKRGYTPIKGVDYMDGLPGEPGAAGSPDTPEQVVEKVNAARKKISIGAIAGLPEEFKKFAAALREKGGSKGGGGMGNPQHETFTISASTTAVTTAFPIAARGNAIFKSAYQGMALDKDVHYTVGTNRKTLTFAAGVAAQFENNTTFSITYLRG